MCYDPLFIEKIDPLLAVVSVGENSYGHPHQEVLEMLTNYQVVRTDNAGDIKLITDGQSFELSLEKELPK